MVRDDTFLIIDELENSIPYKFSVMVYTTAGESQLSDLREASPRENDRVSRAPSQPRAVSSKDEVEVSWLAPEDSGIVNGRLGQVIGYNIYYAQDSFDVQSGTVEEVSPTGGDVPLFGRISLTDGDVYYFAVAAVTPVGVGELSMVVQTDRAPGKPAKPSAVPGEERVTVSWLAPDNRGIVGGVEGRDNRVQGLLRGSRD